jgi:hypothetical protein
MIVTYFKVIAQPSSGYTEENHERNYNRGLSQNSEYMQSRSAALYTTEFSSCMRKLVRRDLRLHVVSRKCQTKDEMG